MRRRLVISASLAAVLAVPGGAALYYFNAMHPETKLIESTEPKCIEQQGYCISRQEPNGAVELPINTAYWSGTQKRDEEDLPYVEGPSKEVFRNVSSIAFAIVPRGEEYGLIDGCRPLAMSARQMAAFRWFEGHAEPLKDAVIWRYNYDTQVNDVVVKAGWPSAFSQAAIILRLMMAECTTGDAKYLELARRAGKALLIPVSEGGLRSNNDDFVWFQEVPIADEHAPFILNAHLYSIFTLFLLDRHFPNEGFREAALKGLQALDRSLSAIDNGYWNRYDLRPRYPAATFLLNGGGHKVQSLTLSLGQSASSVNFSTGKRDPAGNSVWGDVNGSGDGKTLVFGDKVYAQFILPAGRKFTPNLLQTPSRFVVEAECCGKPMKLYAFGFRPNLNDYYELPEIGRTAQGNSEKISFATGLYDYAWGQVAQEYIPFHADMMALISRLASKPGYLVYAHRWENLHRNWLREKEQPHEGVILRRRHRLEMSDPIATELARHFDKRPPGEVSPEELREFIDGMVTARHGTACKGEEQSASCDLQRSLLQTFALD